MRRFRAWVRVWLESQLGVPALQQSLFRCRQQLEAERIRSDNLVDSLRRMQRDVAEVAEQCRVVDAYSREVDVRGPVLHIPRRDSAFARDCRPFELQDPQAMMLSIADITETRVGVEIRLFIDPEMRADVATHAAMVACSSFREILRFFAKESPDAR